MTEKKRGGNIREGDIKDHNPLKRVRIEEAREREADDELKDYKARYEQYVKEWEECQGHCCDWDTK